MPTKTTEKSQTLAIAIDKEHVISALIDTDGILSAVNALQNPVSDSSEAVLETIISVGKQVLQDTPGQEISGIGLVLSAPVNRKNGLVLESENLAQLSGVYLADILQNEFGQPIIIENNVNAMALLEAHSGAARNVNSMFYAFVDNDIQGVIIQDGQIWHGTHSNAGDIANLVADWMGPKTITLGRRASGQGIASEYNMRSRKYRTPEVDEIIQYARQGDNLAIRVIRDGARIFGSVLSPVMNLIDPAMVVVGGRFAHTGSLWWSSFIDTFDGIAPAVRSQYDEEAPLQAAALIAQIASPV